MTSGTYTTTGAISPKKQLILDDPVPLPAGRVRVTIEALSDGTTGADFLTLLQRIHATLRQAGHRPPTADEVAAHISAERDTWQE